MYDISHHSRQATSAVFDGSLVANLPAGLRRHIRGTPTEAFLRRASIEPPLTDDDEAELATRARRGDRLAIERLVLANMRIVVSVAKRFARGRPCDFDDLIQAGVRGLVIAASRFDPERGRLEAFALRPVWRWCTRTIDESRPIRWPIEVCSKLRRKVAQVGEFTRLPTPESWEPQPARMINDWKRLCRVLRQSRIKERYEWGRSRVRGEAAADRDPARRLERAHDLSILVGRIEAEIARWRPRYQIVFRRRFGVGTQRCESLGQIGRDLGVTRERVRQIEMHCVTRLRYALRSSEPVLFDAWIATLENGDPDTATELDEDGTGGADDE
jgi:RNA polymerase sigma factor (sigma-70 family)